MSQGVPPGTLRGQTSLETLALKIGKTQVFLDQNLLWKRYMVKYNENFKKK